MTGEGQRVEVTLSEEAIEHVNETYPFGLSFSERVRHALSVERLFVRSLGNRTESRLQPDETPDVT